MKTDSAITLFATALLLLIITTYHDYNYYRSTILRQRTFTYVSFYNRAGNTKKKKKKTTMTTKKKKKKTRRRSNAYVFVVSIKPRCCGIHVIRTYGHLRMPGSRVYSRVHARRHGNPARRELHYILLDYINSVDVCARASVTFCTRTFGM